MIYQQTYTIENKHTDRNGRVRPSAFLGFALDAAGKHCARLNADRTALEQRNLFWAVLRHRLQILRYPASGEVLTVKTWPMPTTRAAFPRAAEGVDENGQVVFRLVSLWVLMDISARTMVLPGKTDVGVAGTLLGCELPTPPSILPKELTEWSTRTVCGEDLDLNNHMTNARYLDWIDDLQTDAFRKTHPPREIQICYLSEVLPNQTLSLGKGYFDDNFLQVEGFSDSKDPARKSVRMFTAKIIF